MKFLKSKIKRCIFCLSMIASMLTFSVSPVFAQEMESTNSEETPVEDVETVKTVDLSTIISDINLEPRAGNETWVGSGFGGSYTFTDYNLTPIKTMGQSGTLVISGIFRGTDGYANVSRIKLTVQIRSTSGSIKSSTVVVDDRSGSTAFSVSCSVSQGETIQLFFDASSVANPPGIYRSAFVDYDFAII